MILRFTNTPLLCQKFLEALAFYGVNQYKIRYHVGEVTAYFISNSQHYSQADKVKAFMSDYLESGDIITLNINE